VGSLRAILQIFTPTFVSPPRRNWPVWTTRVYEELCEASKPVPVGLVSSAPRVGRGSAANELPWPRSGVEAIPEARASNGRIELR